MTSAGNHGANPGARSAFPLLRDADTTAAAAGLVAYGDAIIPPVAAAIDTGLSNVWFSKAMQLYHTQTARHGIILVGPTGTGKTSAWRWLCSLLI